MEGRVVNGPIGAGVGERKVNNQENLAKMAKNENPQCGEEGLNKKRTGMDWVV